jgi:membrane fusion protein (multidrug efflux system)
LAARWNRSAPRALARADEAIEITSNVTNIVTRIRFTEGQPVARGAALVEFAAAEARADLAEAQAALAESRRQFERSQDLATRKLISDSHLDRVAATLEANKARVAGAEARLANMIIRAPFAGRTRFRRVSVGSLVSPGALITTLDDLQTRSTVSSSVSRRRTSTGCARFCVALARY